MGFKVIKNVDVFGVGELTEFYVRVDKYTVYRNRSCIDLFTGHFISPDAAISASGIYLSDDFNDYSGQLSLSMSFDDSQIRYDNNLSIELLTTEEGHEPYMSASFQEEMVDIVDYDDDGNEIITQELGTTIVKTESTTKHRKNISIISSNIYEFAYEKLKEKYQADFNPCTIEDVL